MSHRFLLARTPFQVSTTALLALLVGCGSHAAGGGLGTGSGANGGTTPIEDAGELSEIDSGNPATEGDAALPPNRAPGADAGEHDAATTNPDAGGGSSGGGGSGGTVTIDAGAYDDAGTSTGTIYYVATTGDDSNAGTLAAPWKTISYAMTTVAAGSTVMVRAGVYSEQVEVGVSGAAGSPITLQSYPGELATIDGTSVPVIDGVGLIDINAQSYLIVSGLEIRNWTSTTSAVPAGIFVQGASVGIQLLSNHVHNIVTTVGSCNGAGGNAFGVGIYGTDAVTPISGLLIHGNELDSLQTGCSESMTVNGNVDGFEVSNNTVHDNQNIGIDAIGYEGTSPTASLDMARNGIIRANTVYNITSADNPAYAGGLGADGIYVDGAQSILIEQNLVYNTDIGIEMESEHSGHTASYVIARNNVVYYSNLYGASIGGYDTSVGGADHCIYVNNTFYDNALEFSINNYITDSLYENNLVYDSAGAFTEGTSTGVTSDHDLTLQSGAASVFVNPGTPPTGSVAVDLHVAAATLSQVQNQGVALACPSSWTCPAVWGTAVNGTEDFAGSPRTVSGGIDIGAYQQ